MKRSLQLILLFTFSFSFLKAQEIVTINLLESRTKAQLVDEFGSFMTYGADLYRVTYETLDIYGQLDTASGLYIYPVAEGNDRIFPMLIYQHGTVGSRDDVPSELEGGYQLALFWAGAGYATTAADFLGLGTSRGFHPYVHSDTEASAAIDLHLAAKQYSVDNDLYVNNQLFVTGYSQGGHAALAAQKMIQEDYAGELNVTASAPMSGPYSISGVMQDLMLGDEEYFFVAYAPFSMLSYNLEYNIFTETVEVFKEPAATWSQQFYDEEIDLWELNNNLIAWLTTTYGGSFPKYIFQDAFIDEIESDPDHPANQALRDNDLYNWAPTSATRLYYCMADDQVPFMNSIIGRDSMQAAGATNVLAIDVNSGADHGECVNPATTAGFIFFSVYQSIGTILNTLDIDQNDRFQVIPNPATDQITIIFENEIQDFEQIELFSLNGQSLRTITNQTNIHLNGLTQGIYFVKVTSKEGVWIEKVIVK